MSKEMKVRALLARVPVSVSYMAEKAGLSPRQVRTAMDRLRLNHRVPVVAHGGSCFGIG